VDCRLGLSWNHLDVATQTVGYIIQGEGHFVAGSGCTFDCLSVGQQFLTEQLTVMVVAAARVPDPLPQNCRM